MNFPLEWVIPLGLEPKTHALEGRCSNPTELRNQSLFRAQNYDILLNWQSEGMKFLDFFVFIQW